MKRLQKKMEGKKNKKKKKWTNFSAFVFDEKEKKKERNGKRIPYMYLT